MNPYTKQGLTSSKSASGAYPYCGAGVKKLFKQKGFSLAEMTIVTAILALIISTVYLAYVLNQRVYLAGENIAEITQNGRVILERMTREIRQAKEIVTELPEENEIIFQDGHLSLVSEEGTAQGGTINTITLDLSASDENDYYKDMFIEIIGGTGNGQIKKIIGYEGTTKTAEIETYWDPFPDGSSIYKIDTSYYYIRYHRDDDNYIWREVLTYCFSEDEVTCDPSKIYCAWDTDAPIAEITLENPRIIGEYVTNLEFWGSRMINIFLTSEKRNKSIDFQTKIFGRNL